MEKNVLNIVGKTEQLCWSCSKSTNSGCSWSRNLEPVDGWTAIEREDDGKTRYRILDCPEFTEDNLDSSTIISTDPFYGHMTQLSTVYVKRHNHR